MKLIVTILVVLFCSTICLVSVSGSTEGYPPAHDPHCKSSILQDEECTKGRKKSGCPVEVCGTVADFPTEKHVFYGDGLNGALRGLSRAYVPNGGDRLWDIAGVLGVTLRSGMETVKDKGLTGIQLGSSGEGSAIDFSIKDCATGKTELSNRGAIADFGTLSGQTVDRVWKVDSNDGKRKYLQYPNWVSHTNPGKPYYATTSKYEQAYNMQLNSETMLSIGGSDSRNHFRPARLFINGQKLDNDDGLNVTPELPGATITTGRFAPLTMIRDVEADPGYISSNETRKTNFRGRLNTGGSHMSQLNSFGPSYGFGPDGSYEIRLMDGVNYEILNIGAIMWYPSPPSAATDFTNGALLSKRTGAQVTRPWVECPNNAAASCYAQFDTSFNPPRFIYTTSTSLRFQKYASMTTPHEGGRMCVNCRREGPRYTIDAQSDTLIDGTVVGGWVGADKGVVIYSPNGVPHELTVTNAGVLQIDGSNV